MNFISNGAVQFKHSRFALVRNDADFIVLSNKYVDEIRSHPVDTLSPTKANVDVWLRSKEIAHRYHR